MSLDYKLGNVEDFEALAADPVERVVTECVIFLTMAVGLGEITTSNVDEFAMRVLVHEGANGPLMRDGDGQPRPMTYADIERRIGLTTNVAQESRAAWQRRLMSGLVSDAEYTLSRQRAAANA